MMQKKKKRGRIEAMYAGDFARSLRAFRDRRDLSRYALARAIRKSERSIQRWEDNTLGPLAPDIVEKLADALLLTAEEKARLLRSAILASAGERALQYLQETGILDLPTAVDNESNHAGKQHV